MENNSRKTNDGIDFNSLISRLNMQYGFNDIEFVKFASMVLYLKETEQEISSCDIESSIKNFININTNAELIIKFVIKYNSAKLISNTLDYYAKSNNLIYLKRAVHSLSEFIVSNCRMSTIRLFQSEYFDSNVINYFCLTSDLSGAKVIIDKFGSCGAYFDFNIDRTKFINFDKSLEFNPKTVDYILRRNFKFIPSKATLEYIYATKDRMNTADRIMNRLKSNLTKEDFHNAISYLITRAIEDDNLNFIKCNLVNPGFTYGIELIELIYSDVPADNSTLEYIRNSGTEVIFTKNITK